MLGPLDYVFALASLFLEVYVVVCLCASRYRFRYISVNIYMLAVVGASIGQDVVLWNVGVRSPLYAYVYYYTDALLTISLFFVIMSFYYQVFQQMGAGKYVRWGSILLLSGTALLSYLIVRRMPTYHDHARTQFVIEMSQNLYFVGVVLTYLLWGAVIKLGETRTRLIQLILALGIFFSADAANYALYNLYPGLEANFLKWIPPVMGTFLPLAWAYTFTKIPEEARLETARVATRASVQQMAAHQHS